MTIQSLSWHHCHFVVLVAFLLTACQRPKIPEPQGAAAKAGASTNAHTGEAQRQAGLETFDFDAVKWRGTINDTQLAAVTKMLSLQKADQAALDCVDHLRNNAPRAADKLSRSDEERAIAVARKSLAVTKVEGLNIRVGRTCTLLQLSVSAPRRSSVYLLRPSEGDWKVILQMRVEH